MNATFKTALMLALLAGVAACGQADIANNQAASPNNDQASVQNGVLSETAAPTVPATTAPAEPTGQLPAATDTASAAPKIAPVPSKAPQPKAKAKEKAPPPVADPHAGHDMANMSSDDMANMQH